MRILLGTLIALALSCAAHEPDEEGAEADSTSRESARRRTSVPLVASYSHTCAISRRRIRCWGGFLASTRPPPAVLRATQLTSSAYNTCALADEAVTCWGANDRRQSDVPDVLRAPREVASGWYHGCAITGGGVKCWGNDDHAQLRVPGGLKNPRQLSAGSHHTCLIDDDGVKCWGNEDSAPPLRNPSQLSVGAFHSCAIHDDRLTCWGDNGDGRTDVPKTLQHPRQVTAGHAHTCAIDDRGVSCWGNNTYHQTEVPPLHRPRFVSAGRHHTCAIDDDGVACWGDNTFEQNDVPADLEFIGRHACVSSPAGARCVGDNEIGQLGLGDDEDRLIPLSSTTRTDLGRGFEAPLRVDVGRAYGCALSTSGSVKCWGSNAYGQLGLGDDRDRGLSPDEMGDALPTLRFEGGVAISRIDIGERHGCAVGRSGELFCWGAGSSGKLGTEATDDVGGSSDPKRPRLKDGLMIRDVALGREHTCALSAEGDVYCFGKNDRGQLGAGRPGAIGDQPGSMGAAMRRVDLGDGFVVRSLASGDEHVCALSIAGRVKCWGANESGQLGLGDTSDRGRRLEEMGAALPSLELGKGQVGAEIACGARHCCVRMLQNTIKCWGDNAEGQLGLGDVAPRGTDAATMGDDLPFVLTPPGETVFSIQLTAHRTCARTESGLRCWGANRSGELGYGDREPRGGSLTTIPRLLPALGI